MSPESEGGIAQLSGGIRSPKTHARSAQSDKGCSGE